MMRLAARSLALVLLGVASAAAPSRRILLVVSAIREDRVGEFLILMGTFKISFIAAILASLGVILSAAYMLWLYRRVIFGSIINNKLKDLLDLTLTEKVILWTLAIPTIFFGFYPQPLFSTIDVSITSFLELYNLNVEINLANNK